MPEFTAIKPLGTYVLVESIAAVGETQAGLKLPQGYQQGPPRSRIVAVSPEVDAVKPGDVVGIAGGTGLGVPYKDTTLFLVKAEQIVCVFDEEQAEGFTPAIVH